MTNIPECLTKRYKATDDLMQELTETRCGSSDTSSDEPGVKLMCQFWNILQEHPNLNLTQAVKDHMDFRESSSCIFKPQKFDCYTAAGCTRRDVNTPQKGACSETRCKNVESGGKCTLKSSQSASSAYKSSGPPLSKVLCDLNEAASFSKKCCDKVRQLKATQKELQTQITNLENREKEGIQLLKQADCMWSTMEEAYKKKIAESSKRQEELLKQLKEADVSNAKWRKNKKDLEAEMTNLDKCHKEILEKTNQKSNDIKSMKIEIDHLQKKIVSNKSDLEATKKLSANKKKTTDAKIREISAEVIKLEKNVNEEQIKQKKKEAEGNKYLKDAREDLQTLAKLLVQRKIENENLTSEREALRSEIELMTETFDQCKNRCKDRENNILKEIATIEKEIAEFQMKCIRCHQCTDTVDVRTLCTDCPRCLQARECINEEDCCSRDKSYDCVCMYVKKKFLDNVFKNMSKVLEECVKQEPGMAAADSVINCLRHSRNGKLDTQTRKKLQDFIMSTIKKKLDLTIIGGAVKTRCEMDDKTYKQLMLCLKQVHVSPAPQKTDKGTDVKKAPCPRWGDASECNCPKGWNGCVCTSIYPKPRSTSRRHKSRRDDGSPSRSHGSSEFGCRDITCLCYKGPIKCKRDSGNELQSHTQDEKESPLSDADGANLESSDIGTEVTPCKLNTSKGPKTRFGSMRAVQCVLGPEVLFSCPTCDPTCDVNDPMTSIGSCSFAEPTTSCASASMVPCKCAKECLPRDRIIEEVLGDYTMTTRENITCNCGNEPSVSCKCEKDTQQLKAIATNECNKPTNTLIDDCGNFNYLLISQSIKGIYMDQSKDTEADKCVNTNIQSQAITNEAHKIIKVDLKDKKSDVGLPIKGVLENLKKVIDKNILKLIKKHSENDISESAVLETDKPSTIQILKSSDLKPDSKFTKYVLQNVSFKCKDKRREIKVELQNNRNDKVSGYLSRTLSGHLAIDIRSDLSLKNNVSTCEKTKIVCVNDKEPELNIEELKSESLNKLKIESHDFPEMNSFFVIKKKSMYNYEVVLNKEYENIIKKAIREHKSDCRDNMDFIFKLKEIRTGIIEIKPKIASNTELKDAIIFRTSSGNIKVLSADTSNKNIFSHLNDRSSLITQMDFRDLITKLHKTLGDDIRRERLQRTPYIYTESKSDSNVYMCHNIKTKFNNNRRYIKVSKFLKRTDSGNYVLVLYKTFYQASSHATENSNNLKIPITFNRNIDLNLRCKFSPHGSKYVIIDKDEIYNIVNESSDIFIKYDSKENIHIYKSNNLTNQEMYRTCSDNTNADCKVCKDLKFDIQNCMPNVSIQVNDIPLYDNTLNYYWKNDQKVHLDKVHQLNINNTPSSTIDEQRCCEVVLENFKERPRNFGTKPSCQVDERCARVSQEENIDLQILRQNFLRDSLELLPPQLPSFLRGYIHI